VWNILKSKATPEDVISALEAILAGTDYVWGDFTDVVILDPRLDALRQAVVQLEVVYPPGPDDHDVGPEGQRIIAGYIRELRAGTSSWLE
jgi:hypothetical protein